MAAKVTILHGPIRTGKTTRLARWSKGRTDVGGLLQPDGPDGRYFHDIATGDAEPLEPAADGEPTLRVGRFRFRAHAFSWAARRLGAHARVGGPRTLIVDEIGPLELAGGGLRAAAFDALSRHGGELVLVVRTPLVADVLDAFGIGQAQVLAATDWPQAEQTSIDVP